jgi:hypothetical protein
VELNEWIDAQGGVDEAAKTLGESRRAVASWYYAERAPKLKSAVNIIEKSGYLLDFNGILKPIARSLLGFKEPEE